MIPSRLKDELIVGCVIGTSSHCLLIQNIVTLKTIPYLMNYLILFEALLWARAIRLEYSSQHIYSSPSPSPQSPTPSSCPVGMWWYMRFGVHMLLRQWVSGHTHESEERLLQQMHAAIIYWIPHWWGLLLPLCFSTIFNLVSFISSLPFPKNKTFYSLCWAISTVSFFESTIIIEFETFAKKME